MPTVGRLRTWGILVSLMIMALNFNRTLQAQHAEYHCMCLKLLDYFGRIPVVISIIIIPTMLKNGQENHFRLFQSCPEFPEFFWNLQNWLEVRLERRMSYEHAIITLQSIIQHLHSLPEVRFGKE